MRHGIPEITLHELLPQSMRGPTDWVDAARKATAESRTAAERRQELARLPGRFERAVTIARDERYQTYALAFTLLVESQAAATLEAAEQAASLAELVAGARVERNPQDRLGQDLVAAANLALARLWRSLEGLEAAWRRLTVAEAAMAEGTHDATLAASLTTERAALLRDRGCLWPAAREALHAFGEWMWLGDEEAGMSTVVLRDLIAAELAAGCLAAQPEPGAWHHPRGEDTVGRLRQLLDLRAFPAAAEVLRSWRRQHTAATCRGGEA